MSRESVRTSLRITICLLLLVGFFSINTLAANADDNVNLVRNPDFDNGTLSWASYNEGGTGSFSVTDGVATLYSGTKTERIYQGVNVSTGKYVNFSAEYNTTDETYIRLNVGSSWYFIPIINDSNKHVVTLMLSPTDHTNNNVTVYLSTHHHNTTLNLYWVNCSISDTNPQYQTPLPENVTLYSNILPYNVATACEYNNTSGFNIVGGGSLSVENYERYQGATSLKTIAPDVICGWKTTDFTVEPNKTYSISFKNKGLHGGERVYFLVEDHTTGNTSVPLPCSGVGYITLTQDWVQYNATFKTNTSTTKVYIQEYIGEKTEEVSTWYTDDIQLFNDSYSGYNKYTVKAGEPATVYLRLSSPATTNINVNYATSNGSINAIGNYTPTTGTVTFNPGDSVKTVTVNTDDNPLLLTAGYIYFNITSATCDISDYKTSFIYIRNKTLTINPYTVVCGIDSITYGYASATGTSWVAQLQLDQPVYNFINAGISGDTTSKYMARHDYSVARFKPGYEVYLGGINNLIGAGTPETVYADIQTTFNWSIANGTKPIVGELIPDNEHTGANAKVIQLNSLLNTYATTNEYPLIPFYSAMEYPDGSGITPTAWTFDGVHPTDLGSKIMADNASLVFDTINPTEYSLLANFTASAFCGIKPLTISFTDSSTGTVDSYLWTFGDGATSTEQNPTHQYTTTGIYDVTLTVTNDGGSNTMTKASYIVVNSGVMAGTFDTTSIGAWWILIVGMLFLAFLGFIAVISILALRSIQSGNLNVDMPTLINASIGLIVFVSIITIGSFIIYLIVSM